MWFQAVFTENHRHAKRCNHLSNAYVFFLQHSCFIFENLWWYQLVTPPPFPVGWKTTVFMDCQKLVSFYKKDSKQAERQCHHTEKSESLRRQVFQITHTKVFATLHIQVCLFSTSTVTHCIRFSRKREPTECVYMYTNTEQGGLGRGADILKWFVQLRGWQVYNTQAGDQERLNAAFQD